MSSVLKATIENKTTSATTYFKKLTTGSNFFIVSDIHGWSCLRLLLLLLLLKHTRWLVGIPVQLSTYHQPHRYWVTLNDLEWARVSLSCLEWPLVMCGWLSRLGVPRCVYRVSSYRPSNQLWLRYTHNVLMWSRDPCTHHVTGVITWLAYVYTLIINRSFLTA